MDWSNEDYVRLYTRETDDDLVLSWQARALWHEMLKKFDRSGLIALRRGRVGLAALVRMPFEVVDAAIPELLEDGRVRELDTGYFAPNFMEAQEATKSDKQRQKESRERRRARSMAGSHPVTERDDAVTNRDALPDPVTKRDADVTNRDRMSRGGGGSVTLTSADPDPDPLLAEPPPAPAEEALPAPRYPISQIHNPRTKLNHDAWQYAAFEHARLTGEGLTGSMPWPAMPAGAPMSDLVDRVRELVDQHGGDVSKAAAVLRRRVDVAAAESKREGHLRWFTPSQLWDDKRFYRAIEIDPADAAKPRQPPRGSLPPEQPIRKVKTFT